MDTKGEKSGQSFKPQMEQKHPDRYADDLNPNRMQGQNVGPDPADREVPVQTAYDVKELHRSLRGFTDDELKQIPIVREGSRLEQGATYLDLADRAPTEVKVNAGVTAEPGRYYVAKNRVPYTIWNRLIGEEKPGQ